MRLTHTAACGSFRNPRVRRGISFIEVLFAIMILGLGFIMVAAMFPVAAEQNLANYDQTMASQMAEGASKYLTQAASNVTMPRTLPLSEDPYNLNFWSGSKSQVWSYLDERYGTSTSADDAPPQRFMAWNRIKDTLINSADARYAWTAAFSRDYGKYPNVIPYGQCYIWVLRNRNRAVYTEDDVDGHPSFSPRVPTAFGSHPRDIPELRPKDVSVFLREGTVNGVAGPDIIYFTPPVKAWNCDWGNLNVPTHEAVAEGCFVVISDDYQDVVAPNSTSVKYRGHANGRVLRVGIRRPDLDKDPKFPASQRAIEGVFPQAWELIPGWDMASGIGCMAPGPDLILHTPDDNQTIPLKPGFGGIFTPARALIVGRGFKNPAKPSEGFDGPAQDVGFFNTYVAVTAAGN